MNNIVWSSEMGDTRKQKKNSDKEFDIKKITLKLRRLTAGKGRTVIEITGLPENDIWCKELAKDLKKGLGVAGSFKNSKIEIHGENMEKVQEILNKKDIKWKKTGG